MTYTIQPRSLPMLGETSKNLDGDEPLTEEDVYLLLSILDGMKDLYEILDRLNYEIEKKCME